MDPDKVETARQLGFQIQNYVESIPLPKDVRAAIANYLAALLVRHPKYLQKLIRFHKDQAQSSVQARNLALENMLWLFDLYRAEISRSVLMISRRVGSAEYLYADGGLMVEEPWRKRFGIPFDIHAPLTPELAIEVLPSPLKDDLNIAIIMEANNQGVARQNRIVLGGANRFVFSRNTPPSNFIKKYFGIPAPKNVGYRIINGNLETVFDPARK